MLGNIFKKGAFTYDPNMTPQQLADKRAMLAMLQPKYGKASYIGEGLGQLATGVATGIRTRKLDEIEGKGRDQGADLFSSLFGGTTQSTSGQSGPMNILGVDPGYSAPPSEGAAVADDAMLALGKTPMRPYRDAIAGIESAGSGDYGAIGPTHPKMGRALGRYQIMEANIGPWSKAALGREVSADEFMNNPQLQDAIFDHVFGGYVDQYGPEGAAQAWFAGPGGVGKTGRKDVLGTTVGDYGQMFMGALNGPVAAPAGASTATNSAMPSIDPQALAAALANPWLSPEERSVLTMIYDQQVQAGDPLRQIEVAKGMAELEKMNAPPAPPEDFTTRIFLAQQAGLEPGTPEFQTYLLTGELPEAPEAGYNMLTPEEVAQLGLPPGAYQRGGDGKIVPIGKDGVTVNVGGDGAPGLGKLSADYGYVLDPITRQPVIDPETGLPKAAPVPGSPAAREIAATTATAEKGQQNAATATEVVTSAAARAREANAKRSVGGIFGQWATMNPSSENAELYRQVDVLKSNAKVENLNAMRQASPTGGALGSVTEKEADMLAAKSGALDPASPYFERDLADYELTLLRTVHGFNEGNRIFAELYPEGVGGVTAGAPAPAAGGGATINGYTIKPVN